MAQPTTSAPLPAAPTTQKICGVRRRPSKYFLQQLSLSRLYATLVISFLFFLGEMVVAHMAHSLVLQVDAYHMLYNIFALVTSIITTKMCREGSNLKNTFGWTRIDVCGAVAGICFMAASFFSVVVEALQAILHSSHHERMAMPFPVLLTGMIGVVVNLAASVIIGGYTHQQKGFLASHKEGHDIMITPSASSRSPTPRGSGKVRQWECGGPFDTLRDFLGCFIVIGVALVVYFYSEKEWAHYMDPTMTILEVFALALLSYKYAMEAGYILLLTIPNNINVKTLLAELYASFPEIYDVHEFHIWQLNPSRIIATAHVVLRSTEHCWTVQNNIIEFLEAKGITHVTLQPEFLELMTAAETSQSENPSEELRNRKCFLPCKAADGCHEKKCCPSDDKTTAEGEDEGQGHGHSHGQGQGQSHGHGHSHTPPKIKTSWTWKLQNPFKSSSSNLSVKSRDRDIDPKGHGQGHGQGHTHDLGGHTSPKIEILHKNKSNPELSKVSSSNLSPDPKQLVRSHSQIVEKVSSSSSSSSSSGNSEDEARKPMI